MFTGLVQNIGILHTLEQKSGKDLRMEIKTDMDLSKTPIGASICCSGCCLTVTDKGKDSFFVDVSNETCKKTTFGSYQPQMRLNLEPSLKLGDEMGGHIVSGHVDTTTPILKLTEESGSHYIEIQIPKGYEHFIAPKGSIVVDGISLTVNNVQKNYFSVNIIPHTWKNTTLSDRKVGDSVNIEIDLLARYVARIMEFQTHD